MKALRLHRWNVMPRGLRSFKGAWGVGRPGSLPTFSIKSLHNHPHSEHPEGADLNGHTRM